MSGIFKSEFFDFFGELMANNNREWFNENKDRYIKFVKDPMLVLIQLMGPQLHEISENFVADPRPNGGSMFRIYRDVRFSKNKDPYKTHAAVQFRHVQGKDVHCPGFYMHAGLESIVLGCGIWRPDKDVLANIRRTMDKNPKAWKDASSNEKQLSTFELVGDVLKRPPKGWDKDHPMIEDLKRKDFILSKTLERDVFLSADLPQIMAESYAAGAPLMRFLCKASGVDY